MTTPLQLSFFKLQYPFGIPLDDATNETIDFIREQAVYKSTPKSFKADELPAKFFELNDNLESLIATSGRLDIQLADKLGLSLTMNAFFVDNPTEEGRFVDVHVDFINVDYVLGTEGNQSVYSFEKFETPAFLANFLSSITIIPRIDDDFEDRLMWLVISTGLDKLRNIADELYISITNELTD